MTNSFGISRAKAPDAPSLPESNRDIMVTAKGGGIVFVGSLFRLGTRFFIGIVLARLLGAEQLGLYNLALTAAMVAGGLALLGFKPALVRYVSLYVSRRDEAGLWGTLQVGLGLPLIMSLLLSVSVYAFASTIAEQLFHDARLVPLIRLTSVMIPFIALSNLISAATQGFKKMQYAVIAGDITQPVMRLILISGLAVYVGLTAAGALTVFGVTAIVISVLLLYYLNKLFSLKRPLRAARRDFREMSTFSLPIYLSDLVNTFGGNVQTVLLGALNTVTTVGIFAVAVQVNIVSKLFHSAVVTASMPVVSELYGREEWAQMGRFYQTVSKWTFALNVPLFLIVLLFPEPILSIFGKSFVGGATALVILAFGNLVRTSTGICGVIIDMTGNTSLKLVNSVVAVVITVGLNVLLIPTWGLVGAAIASLVAAIIINLLRLLQVFFLFRLIPYNLSFVKPLTAGVGALLSVVTIGYLFPGETSFVFVVMNVAILIAVYVGVTLLLGLSQEDRAVLSRVITRARAMLHGANISGVPGRNRD